MAGDKRTLFEGRRVLAAWAITVLPHGAWATEVSGNLTDAVLDNDVSEVRRILEEGVDVWPTIDALREHERVKEDLRRVATLVIDAATATAPNLRVRSRALSDPVAWVDLQLADKLEGPFLCAAVAFEDAWLTRVALERGETTSTCEGQSVTLLGARSAEILDQLLRAGAQVDACALTSAVKADQPGSVELLLRAGASPRFGCGLVPLFAARSEPVVRALLRSSDLDPFEPSLHIEKLLRTWRYPENAIAVTTRYEDRRDMVLAWAWSTGVGQPDVFAPFLPTDWGQVPHQATPGVAFEDFEAAWTNVQGATGLLRARGDARLGEPLPNLPCSVLESTTDARNMLGPLQRTSDGSAHRYYESGSGHYHQRSRGGRWETASWSMDLALCPELLEKAVTLPVILGSHPWITADGYLMSLQEDAAMEAGYRLWIGRR